MDCEPVPWKGPYTLPCFMSTVRKVSIRKAGGYRVGPNEPSPYNKAMSPQPRPLCRMDSPVSLGNDWACF